MSALIFFVVENENFDGMLVLHRENQLRVHSFLHMMEEMAISHLVFQCRLVNRVLLCFAL